MRILPAQGCKDPSVTGTGWGNSTPCRGKPRPRASLPPFLAGKKCVAGYSQNGAAGGGEGERAGLCPVCCPRCDTRGGTRRVRQKLIRTDGSPRLLSPIHLPKALPSCCEPAGVTKRGQGEKKKKAACVFALKETVSSGERSFLSLIFPSHGEEAGGRAGRTRKTPRAGTSRMTVAQGAVASAPYTFTCRICPQGCEGKGFSKRPGQESRINPRSTVTKPPREGKTSAPLPRGLQHAQPMPSSPGLKKKKRGDEPDASQGCPVAPKARLPPRGRAVPEPPLCQVPRGRAGLREPGPERGDVTLRGERWRQGERKDATGRTAETWHPSLPGTFRRRPTSNRINPPPLPAK